jgi:MFS superfamily sulfate permease-like transporter
MAKAVTLLIILFSLSLLTSTFYYIPLAVLGAVILMAVLNLIDITEFKQAWRLSKNDFLVMVVTFLTTFLLNTEIGLCVGISVSFMVLLCDIAFSSHRRPTYGLMSMSNGREKVKLVRLNSDLVFLSASRIKDVVMNDIINWTHIIKESDMHNSGSIDGPLIGIVLNLVDVKNVDMGGAHALQDIAEGARAKGLFVVIANATAHVRSVLRQSGVKSDLVRRDVMMCVLSQGLHICTSDAQHGDVECGSGSTGSDVDDGNGKRVSDEKAKMKEQCDDGHQHYERRSCVYCIDELEAATTTTVDSCINRKCHDAGDDTDFESQQLLIMKHRAM